MIIYTSGTTGRPKGAVHTHCGFPLKAAMDIALGLDLRREDTLYWMTDMGWMMGPWEVFGTLLLGATMVFYDGAPDFPDVDRLWSLVERHKITTLGVSPTLIRSLMQHGEEPVRRHDLSSLRIMASTGEPWNPEPWLWLFNTVGGGTLPDHQLLRRHRDLGWHRHGQRAEAAQAVRLFWPQCRHGSGCG